MMPYPKRAHCRNNHEFTPENTRIGKDGSRDCLACERDTKERFRKRHGDGASNAQRDIQGATATLRNQVSGDLFTIVRSGFGREAFREIAQACDELGEDWRILCISTPNTILRDMQRDRAYSTTGAKTHRRGTGTHYPERTLLGQIGRIDLLDPSLT